MTCCHYSFATIGAEIDIAEFLRVVIEYGLSESLMKCYARFLKKLNEEWNKYKKKMDDIEKQEEDLLKLMEGNFFHKEREILYDGCKLTDDMERYKTLDQYISYTYESTLIGFSHYAFPDDASECQITDMQDFSLSKLSVEHTPTYVVHLKDFTNGSMIDLDSFSRKINRFEKLFEEKPVLYNVMEGCGCCS